MDLSGNNYQTVQTKERERFVRGKITLGVCLSSTVDVVKLLWEITDSEKVCLDEKLIQTSILKLLHIRSVIKNQGVLNG